MFIGGPASEDDAIRTASDGTFTMRVKEGTYDFQAGLTTSGSGGGMVRMGPPQLRSFTSDDGSFTLDSVPAGATVLTASSPAMPARA